MLNDIANSQITSHFFDGCEQYDVNGKKVLTEQKIEEIKGVLSYIKTNAQLAEGKPQLSINPAGDIPTQIKQLSELLAKM